MIVQPTKSAKERIGKGHRGPGEWHRKTESLHPHGTHDVSYSESESANTRQKGIRGRTHRVNCLRRTTFIVSDIRNAAETERIDAAVCVDNDHDLARRRGHRLDAALDRVAFPVTLRVATYDHIGAQLRGAPRRIV